MSESRIAVLEKIIQAMPKRPEEKSAIRSRINRLSPFFEDFIEIGVDLPNGFVYAVTLGEPSQLSDALLGESSIDGYRIEAKLALAGYLNTLAHSTRVRIPLLAHPEAPISVYVRESIPFERCGRHIHAKAGVHWNLFQEVAKNSGMTSVVVRALSVHANGNHRYNFTMESPDFLEASTTLLGEKSEGSKLLRTVHNDVKECGYSPYCTWSTGLPEAGPEVKLDVVRPRLSHVQKWISEYLPISENVVSPQTLADSLTTDRVDHLSITLNENGRCGLATSFTIPA